eukprot:CFRG6394T1
MKTNGASTQTLLVTHMGINTGEQPDAGSSANGHIRVGVAMHENVETVILLLSVMRAGAIFVPLNPEDPPARLQLMCTSAKVSVVFGMSDTVVNNLKNTLPENVMVLSLSSVLDNDTRVKIRQQSNFAQTAQGHSEQIVDNSTLNTLSPLSHIIFTSGTTGPPKGVLGTHANLIAYMQAKTRAFNITEAERVMVGSTLTFDPCLTDILSTLSTGATLCVLSHRTQLTTCLGKALHFCKATHILTTPALWALVSPSTPLPHLHTIALGGETMPQAMLSAWANKLRIINTYGVTEATAYQTYHEVQGPTDNVSCVGKPLAGNVLELVRSPTDAEAHITSSQGINNLERLVSSLIRKEEAYVSGEVCIGGNQVALGYTTIFDLNQKDPHAQESPFYWKLSGDAIDSDTKIINTCMTSKSFETSEVILGVQNMKVISDTHTDANPQENMSTAVGQSEANDSACIPMYRTGDLGHYDNDGNLCLIGRRDHQVKINGVRLSITEVEYYVKMCELVQDAVCISMPRNCLNPSESIHYSTCCHIPTARHPSTASICSSSDMIDRTELQRSVCECFKANCGAALADSLLIQSSMIPQNVIKRGKTAVADIPKWKAAIPVMVRRVWSRTLGIPECDINRTTHLWQSGGDSLIALRICRELFRLYYDIIDTDSKTISISTPTYMDEQLITTKYSAQPTTLASDTTAMFVPEDVLKDPYGNIPGPFAVRHLIQHPTFSNYVEFLWTQDLHDPKIVQDSPALADDVKLVESLMFQNKVDRYATTATIENDMVHLSGDLADPFACTMIELNSVLTYASKEGCVAVVETMLSAGACADGLWTRQVPTNSPLHMAAMNAHVQCVDVLVTAGARVSVVNAAGLAPLHYAVLSSVRQTDEYSYIKQGTGIKGDIDVEFHTDEDNEEARRVNVLEHLVIHGANLLVKSNSRQTVMHAAARVGNTHALLLIQKLVRTLSQSQPMIKYDACGLRRDSVNVEMADTSKEAKHGQCIRIYQYPEEFLKSMLNGLDRWRRTPLHWAVLNGHFNTAEVLLDLGSDTNRKVDVKQRRSHLPPESVYDLALRTFGVGQMTQLLVKHGAKPLDQSRIQQSRNDRIRRKADKQAR